MNKELETLRKQAEELFGLEKFGEIISLLNDEILERYKDAALYAWRARAHNGVNETDSGFLYAQKAIDTDNKYWMGYYIKGWLFGTKGDSNKAIEDYTKAIELKPDYAIAFNNRGISWGNKAEYDKAIEDFTKAIELKSDFADAFCNRGTSWDRKAEYDKAIEDYTKAIELKPDFELAFYNRGLSWVYKGDEDNAIKDYTKAIELKPDYVEAFNNRGNSWYTKSDYDKAITDYTKAIELNPNYADAFYGRGNSWYKKGDYDKAIDNFKKHLEITDRKKGYWANQARSRISELTALAGDTKLGEISELVNGIKELLLFEKGCITHYTGLSVARILLIERAIFRISEGAFLNDTSEGRELLNFLNVRFTGENISGTVAETFVPKPFIGSFVEEKLHDDLNLWRMYGKDNKEEARGCALTIQAESFIQNINENMKSAEEKTSMSMDDINFYKVAYRQSDNPENFTVPTLNKKKETELNKLMRNFKIKVKVYTESEKFDKKDLEGYINSIAFLFKSDVYKSESEVRLVVNGVGFKKEIEKTQQPPRVYIELVGLKSIIEKITLGPKVERPDEWAAAFYYSYDREDKKPDILISHLPFK